MLCSGNPNCVLTSKSGCSVSWWTKWDIYICIHCTLSWAFSYNSTRDLVLWQNLQRYDDLDLMTQPTAILRKLFLWIYNWTGCHINGGTGCSSLKKNLPLWAVHSAGATLAPPPPTFVTLAHWVCKSDETETKNIHVFSLANLGPIYLLTAPKVFVGGAKVAPKTRS